MVKYRNSDQYKKFSEVCTLDSKTPDTFFINEAFTFEPLSSVDLNSLSLEFELISYSTKDAFGKLSVDYSQEMFDNQLLNLDILPVMSHLDDASSIYSQQRYNKSPMRQQPQANMGHTLQHDSSRVMSVESLNSNGANQRRKLPSLPPAKQLPQIPQALPEQKARQLPKTLPVAPNMRDKFSTSDSETTFNNYNNNNHQFNSTVNNNINSQPSPLHRSNEQLSSASSPRSQVQQLQRDFDLYNSNSQLDSAPVAPTRTLPPQPAKKMLPQGLIRDRKANEANNVGDTLFLGSNNTSNNYRNDNQFNNNVNDNNYNKTDAHNFSNPIRKVSNAQQYLHSSNESLSNQFESNKTANNYNGRFNNRNMNSSDGYSNNGDSMDYNNNTNTDANVTSNNNSNCVNSKHLSPSPSPPLSMQQNSSNHCQQPTRQQQQQNNFPDFEDQYKQGHPLSLDYNSTSSSSNNNNNSRLNANMNRNANNNNPTDFSLIEHEKGANKKPEKLFSPRLNQRLMPQNTNNQQQQQQIGMQAAPANVPNSSVSPPSPPSSGRQPAINNNNNQRMQQPVNGLEFDDTGSIHSCVSKLSSSSVQSEVQRPTGVDKGANRLSRTMIMNGKDIPEDQSGLGLQISQAIESLEMRMPEDQAQQQQLQQKPAVPESEGSVPAKETSADEAKVAKKKKGKLQKGKTSSSNAINSDQPGMSRSLTGGGKAGSIQDINPTHTFFLQYSASANPAAGKVNQSMQNLNKISKVDQMIAGGPSGKTTDGAASDSGQAEGAAGQKKRRPSMAKALVILGLSKKSNSASNLTMNKRFGFARSEEVGMTPELRNRFTNRNRDPSVDEEKKDEGSQEPKPRLWSGGFQLPHESPYHSFIEALGPGQKVSRQVLGLPCLGEVNMSIFLQNEKLTIEVTGARNLKQKTGYKFLPVYVYLKLYLFNGTTCAEKRKTKSQKRTLHPKFDETLKFETSYRGTLLQLTCWGNYGKLDSKVFMGVAQVVLDDLVLTKTNTGWYKLFPVNSIIADFSAITPASELLAAESCYSMNQD